MLKHYDGKKAFDVIHYYSHNIKQFMNKNLNSKLQILYCLLKIIF